MKQLVLFEEEGAMLDWEWIQSLGFKRGQNFMWISPDPCFKFSMFNNYWENGRCIPLVYRTELIELYRDKTGKTLK